MAFSPLLDDAVSRVRFAVGDTSDASPFLPDATYDAALLLNSSNESATIRQIASALAAKYATMPTQLSSDGSGITWGQRISQWNLIAAGKAQGDPAANSSGYGFSVLPTRSDGYST